MGFLKKLKDTAEKGIVKGVELGTRGYDSAMDVAKKGIEKAREQTSTPTESVESSITESIESQPTGICGSGTTLIDGLHYY